MEQANGEDWKNPYARVLGESLKTFVNLQVILVGEVNEVDPNGTSMVIHSTDNRKITVTLPANTMDVPQGIVEIRGTAINHETINCDDWLRFETNPQDFDAETYCEAVRLILRGDTAWTRKY